MRSAFTMAFIFALGRLLGVDGWDVAAAYDDNKADKLIVKHDLADLNPQQLAKCLYASNLLGSFLDFRDVVPFEQIQQQSEQQSYIYQAIE